MRLDKYISNGRDLSRTQVRRLVKAGAITINDEICKNSAQQVSNNDQVTLHKQPLSPPKARYFMLNKPAGYICATHDGEHPTVLELLDEPRQKELQIAGRLDIDTTGLVLITDNGQWNHAVTAPNKHCQKIYHVTTTKTIINKDQQAFKQGLWLDGEKKATLTADLTILHSNECTLAIHEGRYHQVKRMFAAVGNRVESLHRASIGSIILDQNLAPGEYRPLLASEVNAITQAKLPLPTLPPNPAAKRDKDHD